MQKNWYETEKRPKYMGGVSSDLTGCTSTQETESDGVGVVCSDDIARKCSYQPEKNLNSMAIKQQKGQKDPDPFMGE
jgi:hypothetical protein